MSWQRLLAAGIALGPAGAASAGEPSRDELIDALRTEVAELRSEVAELKAEDENWLDGRRAEEVRALVQDVLADADTRASLLQDGLTAGWDGHFFLGSSDGNYLMEISGQMQIRAVYNIQDANADDGDESRFGFENRRTKIVFDGHFLNPTWQYKVQGAFDRDGGAFELEDAYIVKDFENGFEVKVGQYKLPFLREELVSSKRQLAVDRSLVNEEFNQDRSQGVQLSYETDRWRVMGAVSDGFNRDNTAAVAPDTELAVTGRVEVLPVGTWRQFRDFTSPRGSETGLMFGAAFHYEEDEFGTAAGPETERFTWTIDGSAEFDGANLFAAVIGNHLDNGSDMDQYGVVVQGGWYVTDDWEAFVRYEWGDLDVTGVDELNVVTLGVNRYWKSHSLKWTTDIGVALDEVDARFASGGAGYRADADGEEGQVVIRSQIQLLF